MSVMDEAKILLLDEPTAALDPRSAEIVMRTADKIIRDNKLSAVLITHNMKEAISYGNRIVQMAEGKIIKDIDGAERIALQPSSLYEWFM
jgi:putative ABC transport system ATP-binding protein